MQLKPNLFIILASTGASANGRASRSILKPEERKKIMKRVWMILLLSVFAFAATESYAQTSTVKPKPAPGCHTAGVEVHTFYGDRSVVTRAMNRIPAEMSRITTILVETAQTAEFFLYEKLEDGRINVSTWKGAGVGSLTEELSNVMLATRGNACAGEETKRILSQRYQLRDFTVNGSLTIQSAFAPISENYNDGYIRVTVMAHCR